jgi:hypothetical protein
LIVAGFISPVSQSNASALDPLNPVSCALVVLPMTPLLLSITKEL